MRKADIPRDVLEKILGAASYSVFAKRLVFCEGEAGGIDERIYSAWFSNDDTEVFPVGGCDDVFDCVEVFRSSRANINVEAIGVIDRDYWPDELVGRRQAAGVYVLPVHEIESVLCVPGVFHAVAEHLGRDREEADARYEVFIGKARSNFNGIALNKQILERSKHRVRDFAESAINNVPPAQDLGEVKVSLDSAILPDKWAILPSEVLEEEAVALRAAHQGTAMEFLSKFPGKPGMEALTQELGLAGRDALVQLVCTALLFEAKPKALDADLKTASIGGVDAPDRPNKDSENRTDEELPAKLQKDPPDERKEASSSGMVALHDNLVEALCPILPQRRHAAEAGDAETPAVEPGT